jgi:MFS family permease
MESGGIGMTGRKDAEKSGRTDKGVEAGTSGAQQGAGRSLREILKIRNFKLFWAGETISLIGDQFYFIALPWLVLMLTSDVLVLGGILALAAVPRALFMMVGGIFSDRLSPRRVMLVSNAIRMGLVGAMGFIVFANSMQIWMLYLFALSFGVADAFFYPAQVAIIPRLVKNKHLQVANSLVQGMLQLSLLIGPIMAGIVIGTFVSSSTDFTGIGIAFMVDAMTYVASLISLWFIREGAKVADDSGQEKGMVAALKEAFSYTWKDRSLTMVLVFIMAVNFLLVGGLTVGIPVISSTRLVEGAVAYGTIMTALGGGSLLGIIIAGASPRPKKGRLGPTLLVVLATMGLGMISFAYITATWMASLAILTMGAAMGYVTVLTITWVQTRIPAKMMGRIMSLVMFASVGVTPISMVVSGAMIEWNLSMTFIIFGSLMLVIMLGSSFSPHVRRLGFENEDVPEVSAQGKTVQARATND